MLRRSLLSPATVLASIFASGVALAQDAATTAAGEPSAGAEQTAKPGGAEAGTSAVTSGGEVETPGGVLVTGSRLRRGDALTAAPVRVIGRDEIRASGLASIGEFLQSLPEQGNAINRQFNSGGDGSTRIGLRSLGPERTLVLVNGRRVVPGGVGADASVDLNSIPSHAIERIEILKGGASAVYGSDAIAGVVNLVTLERLDSTTFAAYAGTSGEGDGTTYDVSVTTGTSSERGSLLFSASYLDQGEVSAGARDWARNPLDFDYTTGEQLTNESPATPAGGVVVPRTCATARCTALFAAYPSYAGTAWVVDPTASEGFRPFTDADLYNFQPVSLASTPQQRIELFSIGDVRLGDSARGFFEASYVTRESRQQLAPLPLFTFGGWDVSPDSLYNPFGVPLEDVQRRLVEVGPRTYRQLVDTLRLAGGFDGTLPRALGPLGGWSWDAQLGYGRTSSTDSREGELRAPLLGAALGPSMLDPGTGEPICVSTPGDASTVIPGCVPLNLLGGEGSITSDQLDALSFVGTNRGWNQLLSVQANASRGLFRLAADRPASLALGYEYRQLSGAFVANPISAAGESLAESLESIRGSYDSNEVYGELSLPIVSGRSFAQDLELTAAGRWSRYSTFGDHVTYALGARWTIVSDVTVRAARSTAFRAPGIAELYSPAIGPFKESGTDPCAGGPPGSADFIDPASPLGVACGDAVNNRDARLSQMALFGGHPGLEPETADVLSAGVVVEPRAVKNLAVTLDYHVIDVADSIGGIGVQPILNACYPSRAGVAPRFCDRVHRDPATGRIEFVDDREANVGGVETSGVDLGIRYALPSVFGRFGFAFDGIWLRSHDLELSSGAIVDAVGNYEPFIGAALPEYRFDAGVTWGWKGFGAGVSTRYVGSFEECGRGGGRASGGSCHLEEQLAAAEGRDPFKRTVDGWASTDAFASYALRSTAGRISVALGVRNVFDAKPRTIYAAGSPRLSSDPSTYDYVGRSVYVRAEHSF